MKINDCRIKPEETIEVGDLIECKYCTGLLIYNAHDSDGYEYYILDVENMSTAYCYRTIEELMDGCTLIAKGNKLELKINN